jgi:hypothetical protein
LCGGQIRGQERKTRAVRLRPLWRTNALAVALGIGGFVIAAALSVIPVKLAVKKDALRRTDEPFSCVR